MGHNTNRHNCRKSNSSSYHACYCGNGSLGYNEWHKFSSNCHWDGL